MALDPVERGSDEVHRRELSHAEKTGLLGSAHGDQVRHVAFAMSPIRFGPSAKDC